MTEVQKCEGVNMQYNVLVMRKRDTAGHIFGFPDRMDISWITNTQILQKLPVPDTHGQGLLKFASSVTLATYTD